MKTNFNINNILQEDLYKDYSMKIFNSLYSHCDDFVTIVINKLPEEKNNIINLFVDYCNIQNNIIKNIFINRKMSYISIPSFYHLMRKKDIEFKNFYETIDSIVIKNDEVFDFYCNKLEYYPDYITIDASILNNCII